MPRYLSLLLDNTIYYIPGYEPKITGHGVCPGVQTSSRLSGPFWMEPVKAVWRWGRSWKDSTFEKADQMWESLTDRIVTYASEVVASTPHYHTPLVWSYDEDGRIDGVFEGSGRGNRWCPSFYSTGFTKAFRELLP